MLEAEVLAGVFEGEGSVGRTVVGHDATHGDAETLVIGGRSLEVGDGSGGLFIGMDLGEGDARGVVDADVNALPADAARLALAGPVAGHAVSGPLEAAELLDVNVDHVARMGVFIAARGRGRIEVAGPAEPCSPQDAADGGRRNAAAAGDLAPRKALAAQVDDRLHNRAGRGAMQPVRTRGALFQSFRSLADEAPDPFADGLQTDAEGRGDS